MAEGSSTAILISVTASSENDQLPSSPPGPLPSVAYNSKERRQPSITPRKFRRFFTPRSRVSANPSAARSALRDLTALALNRPSTPTSSPVNPGFLSTDTDHEELVSFQSPRPLKKQRTGQYTPETSPLKASSMPFFDATTPEPAERLAANSMLLSPLASSPVLWASEPMLDVDDLEASSSGLGLSQCREPVNKVVSLGQRGVAGQLLQRQLGVLPRSGHQTLPRPVADWKIETADFCTTPDDLHLCSSNETAGGSCIPFCAAACNTNGLVAIGDEEGRIRLLDSDPSGEDSFGNIHVSFAAHGNAVIDLAFSEDDSLLATASGDQTGKVIDVETQIPVSILDHHTASLKQVRFQPGKGQGHVIATSGRDGTVKIWDLRCKGGPAQEVMVERPTNLRYSLPRKVSQGCVVNNIYDAHARTSRQSRQMQGVAPPDVAARWEVPGRVGEVSVTAIQFLPAGKEHLILSACEADASIKLWDIRNFHTSRHKTSTPISITAPPKSHSLWRPFGISSMSLSTDSVRLYALCKDNTVYAYSTAHLVLGYAPELSSRGDPPRRRNGTAQEGLGPLYGFRHENFHATSFYVKTAVRPAKDGRPELLAVGSSDGCAILFPTDERYMDEQMLPVNSTHAPDRGFAATSNHSSFPPQKRQFANSQQQQPRAGNGTRRPGGLFRTSSTSSLHGRLVDTIPIVNHGTALVRGHEKKEVGAVCWTSQGNMVSVGDDYVVRCWREDRDRAIDLRTGGESEGRRWASGWAEVGDSWDEDEWSED